MFSVRTGISYNPERVPSLIVKGQREPLCRDCIEPVNAIRRAAGAPDTIVPLPGAYDAIGDEFGDGS